MTDANSPIHDFYPTDFRVDMEGKRNDWEGVVLIPFIDEARLLSASNTVGLARLSRVCRSVCFICSVFLMSQLLAYSVRD